jgi:hypothetical protein
MTGDQHIAQCRGMVGDCFHIYHPGNVGTTMAYINTDLGTASIGWFHPVFLLMKKLP